MNQQGSACIRAKQKLFGRPCGIMFTATLWMIYIEIAMHTCQDIYFFENHGKI